MLEQELPAEVEAALAPVFALVKGAMEHAMLHSRWLQLVDRKGMAWARAHGSEYVPGSDRAMANALGPQLLLELRQLRSKAHYPTTATTDERRSVVLAYNDTSDLRLAQERIPVVAQMQPGTSYREEYDHDNDDCDCDDCTNRCDCGEDDCDTCHGEDRCERNGCTRCHEWSSCCGCCDECESRHTDQVSGSYTRDVNGSTYCRDCDHTCHEDEVYD